MCIRDRDPYYLTSKSELMGYIPDLINSARRLNDGMPKVVVEKLLRKMNIKGISVKDARILVMGVTFKEDCPDLRNTKVFAIIEELQNIAKRVDIFDNVAIKDQLESFSIVDYPEKNNYDAILICVPHREIIDIGIKKISKFCKSNSVIFDLKSKFPEEYSDLRL